MKNRKSGKMLAVLFAALLLVATLPLTVFAERNGDFSYTVTDDGTARILSYYGNASVLTIPTFLDGYRVTEMDDYSLSNCETLTEVTIPESITKIGSGTFYGCAKLESVRLPSGINEISNYMFADCTSLSAVEIPAAVTKIGWHAFQNCSGLSNVQIPVGVTAIDSYAFSGCTGITEITIPAGTEMVDSSAFYGCTGLTDIKVADGNTAYVSVNGSLYNADKTKLLACPAGKTGRYEVLSGTESVDYESFGGCAKLTEIVFPDSIFYISRYAFTGCTALLNITVSDGSEWYFSDNGVLLSDNETELVAYPVGRAGSFVVPAGVTEIGSNAFWECKGLTEIELPHGIREIGFEAFRGCTGLVGVTVPESVSKLTGYAFCECADLRQAAILADITEIESGLFCDCINLVQVVIPAGVTKISEFAFDGCENLTDVYFCGSESDWRQIEIAEYNDSLQNVKMHYGHVPGTEPEPTPPMVEPTNPEPTPPTVGPTEPTPSRPITGDGGLLVKDGSGIAVDNAALLVNLPAKTSYSSLRGRMQDGQNIQFFDQDGKLPSDDRFVGTGAQILLLSGDGSSLQYTVIVPMDANGDGKVNSADARIVLRAAAKLAPLDGAYAAAGDTDGNNKLTSADARKILRVAAGLDAA